MIVGVDAAPESLRNPQRKLHPLRVAGLAHWKRENLASKLQREDIRAFVQKWLWGETMALICHEEAMNFAWDEEGLEETEKLFVL